MSKGENGLLLLVGEPSKFDGEKLSDFLNSIKCICPINILI